MGVSILSVHPIFILEFHFLSVPMSISVSDFTPHPVYDPSFYKAYLFSRAREGEIVRVSHYFICFWEIWMGCWATIVSGFFFWKG